MMRAAALAVLVAFGLGLAPAQADDGSSSKARAKSTTERRGGYSYSYADTINTYGDARTRGSTNAYRDPNIDRQTNAGPFDHGFFFDSGIGRIGGNSPYLQ